MLAFLASLTSANTVPYYATTPASHSVKINDICVYTLPAMIDDEMDTITVTAVFPTAEGFATFNIPT